MSGTNPQIPQGNLNRVRVHLVFPSYPALNIASSYMGQSFASINFEGPFVEQIATATGIINSPEPYVMMNVNVGIIRTNPLAAAWLTQMLATSIIGNAVVHSDTSAFPAITAVNTSVREYDPGAFDGKDGVLKLSLRGVFYTNSQLWTFT